MESGEILASVGPLHPLDHLVFPYSSSYSVLPLPEVAQNSDSSTPSAAISIDSLSHHSAP